MSLGGSDIEIYRSLHPWKYSFVDSLEFSQNDVGGNAQPSCISITIQLSHNENASLLRLVFQGVREVRMQLMRDSIQLRGLEITDIRSSQWEGLKYFVHETEDNQLSFYCRSFTASILEPENMEEL